MLLFCSDPISTASMDAKVTNWNYPAIMNMCLLLASLAFATTFIVAKMKKYVCGLGYSHGLHLGCGGAVAVDCAEYPTVGSAVGADGFAPLLPPSSEPTPA